MNDSQIWSPTDEFIACANRLLARVVESGESTIGAVKADLSLSRSPILARHNTNQDGNRVIGNEKLKEIAVFLESYRSVISKEDIDSLVSAYEKHKDYLIFLNDNKVSHLKESDYLILIDDCGILSPDHLNELSVYEKFLSKTVLEHIANERHHIAVRNAAAIAKYHKKSYTGNSQRKYEWQVSYAIISGARAASFRPIVQSLNMFCNFADAIGAESSADPFVRAAYYRVRYLRKAPFLTDYGFSGWQARNALRALQDPSVSAYPIPPILMHGYMQAAVIEARHNRMSESNIIYEGTKMGQLTSAMIADADSNDIAEARVNLRRTKIFNLIREGSYIDEGIHVLFEEIERITAERIISKHSQVWNRATRSVYNSLIDNTNKIHHIAQIEEAAVEMFKGGFFRDSSELRLIAQQLRLGTYVSQ